MCIYLKQRPIDVSDKEIERDEIIDETNELQDTKADDTEDYEDEDMEDEVEVEVEMEKEE